MTHPQMLEHIRKVHSVETKGLKARKRMTFHLDCADSYTSGWDVTIEIPNGEIKLTNSTWNPRDPRKFGYMGSRNEDHPGN